MADVTPLKRVNGIASELVSGDTIPAAFLDPVPITIQAEKTSNYIPVLTDAGSCMPAGAGLGRLLLTLSADSTTNFPIGTSLYTRQDTSRIVEFTPASGVTMNAIMSAGTLAQYGWARAIKIAANTWDVFPFTPSRDDVTGGLTSISGTLTLDLSTSDYFSETLASNVSSLLPENFGACRTFSLRLMQPSSGGPFSFAAGSPFYPVAGSDTNVTQTAGAYSMLIATTFDGGTRWEYVMKACG